MKKVIKYTVLAVLFIAIGVGIAHGITYKDKLAEGWNKIFHKTEQKQEEKAEETTQNANISILSNGTIEIK